MDGAFDAHSNNRFPWSDLVDLTWLDLTLTSAGKTLLNHEDLLAE